MDMFVAVILLINYVEIIKKYANEPSTVLAFTDHVSLGSSRFLFDIDRHLFLGVQFIDFFEILAIFV